MTTLIVFGSALLTSVMTAYSIVGTIWLVGYPFSKWRFPRGAAIGLAVVLSLLSMGRQLPGFTRNASTQAQMEEARQLADIYTQAGRMELSVGDIEAAVRGLNIGKWPKSDRDVVLHTLSMRTERYMDLHQSSVTGRVVVSSPPKAINNRDFTSIVESSDATWRPLIQAAASGAPVVFPDGEAAQADELYYLSLMNTWGRWAVFSAIEKVHGISTPLTAADREIGSTLGWVNDYLTAIDGGDWSVLQGSFEISYAFDTTMPLSEDLPETLLSMVDAMGSAGVRRALTYQWLIETTEVDTGLAIGRSVTGEDVAKDWQLLNARRRALGLPMLEVTDQSDLNHMAEQFPWYLTAGRSSIDELAVQDLEGTRAEVEQRYALLTRELPRF